MYRLRLDTWPVISDMEQGAAWALAAQLAGAVGAARVREDRSTSDSATKKSSTPGS